MTKKYLRMTLNERFQHLNLFINFTILVITGFALKYPGGLLGLSHHRYSHGDDITGFPPSALWCGHSHFGRLSRAVLRLH